MSRKFLQTLGFAACLALPANALSATTPETPQATSQRPSNDTLKERIEYRLETSPIVRKYDVKVDVDKNVAKLTGDVATEAQRTEASRLAKIDGITQVDNQIKIDKDVDKTLADRSKSGMRKTGEAITDAWITTKVKWFFLGEDALKGSDINVDTANRVVTLKGTVASEAGRRRAIELATHTDGVTKVVDQLTLKK
jgi:osmotically-inducible protein OsmY